MKFHFSFQHEGTYATSSSTIRGVQNVPNQQCRDFHPTWKFRAGTVPRLPAGRWCWWGNCGQRPRSTTMALPLHFGAKAQSHVGSTHDPHCDTQTEEKVGQGCSPSRGKLGRGATSAPCPLEIRQSFHTVLINWVGQEQYTFSLSFVSKIQGCNV